MLKPNVSNIALDQSFLQLVINSAKTEFKTELKSELFFYTEVNLANPVFNRTCAIHLDRQRKVLGMLIHCICLYCMACLCQLAMKDTD